MQLAMTNATAQKNFTLKASFEDFIVEEILGFDLSGEGEHLWLYIQKTGMNTQEAIKRISHYSNIPKRHIGYSGLKDKQAVTSQWLSLYLPGKEDIDFSQFNDENIIIKTLKRHNKKLKVGTHKQNRFILTLRDIQKEFSEIESTLQSIKQNGYINYYGEQRFGHDNLSLATQWIKGTYTPKRHEKGFLYSVIRAYLFNAYIDDRLAQGTFEKPLIGDIVSLSHGSSFFKVDSAAEKDIKARFKKGEILLAAPLIGKLQKLHYDDEALQSYLRFCEPYQEYIDFLNSENLEMQFRATKVLPENLSYQYNENDNTLVLHFTLIKGAYATTLVDALN